MMKLECLPPSARPPPGERAKGNHTIICGGRSLPYISAPVPGSLARRKMALSSIDSEGAGGSHEEVEEMRTWRDLTTSCDSAWCSAADSWNDTSCHLRRTPVKICHTRHDFSYDPSQQIDRDPPTCRFRMHIILQQ